MTLTLSFRQGYCMVEGCPSLFFHSARRVNECNPLVHPRTPNALED